jgi:hypothetical protein
MDIQLTKSNKGLKLGSKIQNISSDGTATSVYYLNSAFFEVTDKDILSSPDYLSKLHPFFLIDLSRLRFSHHGELV